MPVKSKSSSLAAMMCSLEQPLSLSCIVILNVNQSEVTFLWREWSHQPYVDIYLNFIRIIVQITVNNLVVWNFYFTLYLNHCFIFFQQQIDKQTQPIQPFYLFSFITDIYGKKYADPIRNNVWNIFG